MTKSAANTVILGGNGKTGRRVAERLQVRGETVRLASRSSAIPFDWQDQATWEPALAGARALYLTYYPDLALPGAADEVGQLSRLAARRGVEHIVLLAGRGEPQVHPAEDAVRNSGAAFTILECAFFNQNFNEGLLAPQDGIIAFPAGAVTEPFIDCDDIADVAVAALTDQKHAGKTYELTGPGLLSFAEATAILGSAWEQPLRYQQLSYEEYGQLMTGVLPPPAIDFFLSLFRTLLDGHNAHTTDTVEQILGRPASRFEDFAQRSRPESR